MVALHFTPFQTGFTSAQTLSLLELDTSVSRSLGASFSELIGQPTSPHLYAPGPSIAATVAVTTQRLTLSVASSNPTTDVLVASQAAPTPAQTSSLLVIDTTVSRSLGASFSELTGQPTPSYLHVPGPSTVAPITRIIETLPSSVASSEQAAPVIDIT